MILFVTFKRLHAPSLNIIYHYHSSLPFSCAKVLQSPKQGHHILLTLPIVPSTLFTNPSFTFTHFNLSSSNSLDSFSNSRIRASCDSWLFPRPGNESTIYSICCSLSTRSCANSCSRDWNSKGSSGNGSPCACASGACPAGSKEVLVAFCCCCDCWVWACCVVAVLGASIRESFMEGPWSLWPGMVA